MLRVIISSGLRRLSREKNELMGDFHSLLSTIFETRGYYKLRCTCITVTTHYKKAT